MESQSADVRRSSAGPQWLKAQTVGLAGLVVVALGGAIIFARIGALSFTILLIIDALLALLFLVVTVRAARGAAWSASPQGRDIYEREAWTKPVFGAYRSYAALQRVMFAFLLTIVLTSLLPAFLLLFINAIYTQLAPVILTLLPVNTVLGGLPMPYPEPWLDALIRVTVFLTVYGVMLVYGTGHGHRSLAAAVSKRTGAVPLPTGSAPEATHALARVAGAMGFAYPPMLRSVPSDAVNAWVTGPPERAAIAVTTGMLDAFPPRELEAVFADLLVRAADPLVSDYSRVSGLLALQLDFGASVPRGRLGAPVVPLMSAADSVALRVLRNPDPLIDALQRTRSAASREMPGMTANHFPMLWAWPLSAAATSDHVDVGAERIRALRAVAGFEVDKALTEPMRQWFFLIGMQQHGPVSECEIGTMVREGRLDPNAQVWAAGMNEWRPASAAPGFPIGQ